MATITKIKTKKGASFRAIIRTPRKTITKTFKLRKLAKAWAVRTEADSDLIAAYGSEGATIPFITLADEFHDQWTKKDNITGKVNFWKKELKETKLTKINRAMIRDILDEHAESRSPATVNRKKAMISSIFKYAISKDYVTTNPVTGIPARPENNKRTRFLADEERTALLTACRQSHWDRLYLLVCLALTTGARQGELMGLHWDEIDFQKRTAMLFDTKNGDSRILTIPKSTMSELQRFREVGSGLIFPSPTKWRRPFEFRKSWMKAMKQAGIENFRFHDLRHSAASMLVMNGATLYEAGQVLGHKSQQTTARYAHLSVDHKQALTDRIMGGIK